MDKELKEECMKYVYGDLARISQSNILTKKIGLESVVK